MEKAIDERRPDHLDDECEVIELGSVSEETKGTRGSPGEGGQSFTSRD